MTSASNGKKTVGEHEEGYVGNFAQLVAKYSGEKNPVPRRFNDLVADLIRWQGYDPDLVDLGEIACTIGSTTNELLDGDGYSLDGDDLYRMYEDATSVEDAIRNGWIYVDDFNGETVRDLLKSDPTAW